MCTTAIVITTGYTPPRGSLAVAVAVGIAHPRSAQAHPSLHLIELTPDKTRPVEGKMFE